MFQAEYKRDMYNNFMILNDGEFNIVENHALKMLLNNQIPGLLKMEIRVVDNRKQYYYDISSKQPVHIVFEKGQLTRTQITKLIKELIQIIENAREYLLCEDDFILDPEYVFINISGFQVSLCYAAGYEHPVGGQIRQFIEFLMDKVDYQEDGAVLLTYGLYQLSREKDCTFSKLKDLLDKKEHAHTKKEIFDSSRIADYQNSNIHRELFWPREAERNENNNSLSKEGNGFIKEKVESEVEVLRYPVKTIAVCAGTILLCLIIVVSFMRSGFVYHRISGKIDYIKAFFLLIVIAALEAYVLAYLLQSKNKQPKIEERIEYLQVENDDISFTGIAEYKEDSGYNPYNMENTEENKTIILSERKSPKFYLRALNRDMYQDIYMEKFPFYIGKVQINADYMINNNAVSRFHAKIETVGDNFFVSDLNSTNGTYINHNRLEPNVRAALQINDVVTFADVSYKFAGFSL